GTGLFRDIRMLTQVQDDGLHVIVEVVEKPSVKEVRYSGNDDVSVEDIKGVVDVKPFTVLNHELLKRNVDKIRDLYVEKGHYLAEVSYRVEADADATDQVIIAFDIVENAKVIVKQLTLIGNKHLSDEEIKAVLQTREGGELSWLTQTGTYKEEFFQTDLMRIQALYLDHGFVSVKVGDPVATISQDRRYIYLSVAIDEGEQYRIRHITFGGNVELRDAAGKVTVNEASLRRRLRIGKGELFNRTKLFEDIQAVGDAYRDEGYAYANITPNHEIDPATREVDLELEVDRGEVVYFERIEVVGNTRTRDKVIRREMSIIEGDRYSAAELNSSRARIYQLGFFENVNLATSRGSRPNLMNVTVEMKERPTGTFQIGAGFSSVESFIMTAQVSQNNFLGNGQSLSVSAQLSLGNYARQLATLQFWEPYFLDSDWSLGLDAYITQRFYLEFQRNANGLSPTLGYPITRDLRVNVKYTLEQVEIVSRGAAAGGGLQDISLNRDGLSSALTFSLQYDTRDNRLFPTRGQFHVASIELSEPTFGSDTDMAYRRAQLFFRYYKPVVGSLVFRLNATFGYVTGGGSLGPPISEMYALGGIYDIRGFELRALGPTRGVASSADPLASTSRITIGGNKEVIFNFELELPLLAEMGIKAVAFVDAGNAFSADEPFFSPIKSSDAAVDRATGYIMRSGRRVDLPFGLYYSTGFGFRWFSPIGPLRFEWGFPITKRAPTDKGMIFEFTIGNGF
ncbi:MAG: outer membrane protein assembly factor BamA, partial [Myxococcota bacterium]